MKHTTLKQIKSYKRFETWGKIAVSSNIKVTQMNQYQKSYSIDFTA